MVILPHLNEKTLNFNSDKTSFLFLFIDHAEQCSGLTLNSELRGSLLVGVKGADKVLGSNLIHSGL